MGRGRIRRKKKERHRKCKAYSCEYNQVVVKPDAISPSLLRPEAKSGAEYRDRYRDAVTPTDFMYSRIVFVRFQICPLLWGEGGRHVSKGVSWWWRKRS